MPELVTPFSAFSLPEWFEEKMKGYCLETSPVAVAVSGGADSMALALLLKQWAEAQGVPLIALTVDHGLRRESAAEAKQVAKWMKARNISHRVLSWEGIKPKTGIQEQARAARYQLMEQFCRTQNIRFLFLAHHQGDQAETVVQRLLRGSGVDGLAAMAERSERAGITLLRPLLEVPKSALLSFLTHHKQKWVEDPSNQNSNFSRVRVRRFLEDWQEEVPLARLSGVAGHMRRAAEYITAQVAKEAPSCVTIFSEGYALLEKQAFKTLQEEAALRILSALVESLGNSEHCRFEALWTLYTHIREEEFSGATLGGAAFWPGTKKKHHAQLYIAREYQAIETAALSLKNQQETLWDGRFRCRVESKGKLRLRALGKEGVAFLEEHKIALPVLPKKILYTLPSFWHLETLVSAPHLGYEAKQVKASATLCINNPILLKCFHHCA